MDQRNYQRNPGRGWGQQFGAAPRVIHPDLCHHLEMLRDNPRYVERRDEWQPERQKLCYRIHKLKYDLNRVKELMERRETEFKAELLRNRENISACESEISSLQQELKLQTEQIVAFQNQTVQEKDRMAASLESERQKISEQETELLQLKLESQKSVLLQNQLQIKVHQVEEQLLNKDQELLVLAKKCESLSCSTLQQTFSQELAEKQQEWETTVGVLKEELQRKQEEEEERRRKQEENNGLLQKLSELTEWPETITAESQQSENAWRAKSNDLLESTVQPEQGEEKNERKKKEKEAKEDKKRKEKEEKELKKQQKQEKKEMKKKDKEEKKKKAKEVKESKSFWRWLRKKKSCDGDVKVEEAAG